MLFMAFICCQAMAEKITIQIHTGYEYYASSGETQDYGGCPLIFSASHYSNEDIYISIDIKTEENCYNCFYVGSNSKNKDDIFNKDFDTAICKDEFDDFGTRLLFFYEIYGNSQTDNRQSIKAFAGYHILDHYVIVLYSFTVENFDRLLFKTKTVSFVDASTFESISKILENYIPKVAKQGSIR